MPYLKNHLKVKVPYKSGFDKTHRNSGTLLCGTITPILCDEVVPNSRISLKLNMAAQLPPLVSDTYMNCKLKTEAFFVPSRLLCASYESFFSDVPERILGATAGSARTFVDVKGRVPVFTFDSTVSSTVFGPGTLLDYLGFKAASWTSGDNVSFSFNPMPLEAYHLVWQEWYRNPRVQNPAFAKNANNSPASGSIAATQRISSMPYNFYHNGYTYGTQSSIASNYNFSVTSSTLSNCTLADGVSIFALRQRNFGLDFFTGARLSPQQGNRAAVAIESELPSGTDNAGQAGFTIAALRAANSLQQFRERNNMPSPRMIDQVRARYNANLSDGVAQRPICIGSASYDISSRGIDQTADASADSAPNLFSGVGAQYGRAYSAGSDFIISDFTANEPGYILVNVTLVPEATYSTGIDSMFTRYISDGSITDMACSLLQNVGDEPIPIYTLSDKLGLQGANSWIFGYQDRFGSWMYKPNVAHGKFREGQNLSSFVLQRSYSGTDGELGSTFLEIPTTYLDGVTTVSAATSGVSAWYDCMLDYKVSMPLAEFSIPSLQDPAYEHGDTVSIRRNGQIF